MRSQIGWVARLPITEAFRSTWEPGDPPLRVDSRVTRLLPPQNSSLPWPARSGYVTEALGESGRSARVSAVSELLDAAPYDDEPVTVEDLRAICRSAPAELWGDFEWDDAA